MSDTIEIPVVEICAGWTVDEIHTEDDCDDAFAYLTGALAHIETKLEQLEYEGLKGTTDHLRTKAALRWKKAALQIVQNKRGRITREAKAQSQQKADRTLLDYIAAAHPSVMDDAVENAFGPRRKAEAAE